MPIKVKHIKPEFVDERGFISRILDNEQINVKNILYIKRKKGSRGADHFHKKDKHIIFVLSGKIKYSEKNIKIKFSKIDSVILNPMDMVLSENNIAHSTIFLEDTIFIAISSQERNQKDYEKDTVRVDYFKN